MENNQVRSEILKMTNDELDYVVAVIQNRRNILNSQAAVRLHIGERVWFMAKRHTIAGTVSEIKRTGRVLVTNCSDGKTWSMPASLLSRTP